MDVKFFNQYTLVNVVSNDTFFKIRNIESLPEDYTEYNHMYSVYPADQSYHDNLNNHLKNNDVEKFFKQLRQYRGDIAWLVSYLENQNIETIVVTDEKSPKEYFILLKNPFEFDPTVIRLGTIINLDIYKVIDNPYF